MVFIILHDTNSICHLTNRVTVMVNDNITSVNLYKACTFLLCYGKFEIFPTVWVLYDSTVLITSKISNTSFRVQLRSHSTIYHGISNFIVFSWSKYDKNVPTISTHSPCKRWYFTVFPCYGIWQHCVLHNNLALIIYSTLLYRLQWGISAGTSHSLYLSS